ncbi:unnamed protein product, partial [Trichobilharzia regenti]
DIRRAIAYVSFVSSPQGNAEDLHGRINIQICGDMIINNNNNMLHSKTVFANTEWNSQHFTTVLHPVSTLFNKENST